MSYFLFGSFDAVYNEQLIQQVKSYGNDNNIYFLFNEEITIYNDIHRMLFEQKARGNIRVAITSKNQPCNSSDVLFPFDKFSSEELFEDKTRSFYKKCCEENIDVLFDCLITLMNMLCIRKMDMFVVEGYDDEFQRKIYSISDVKSDLLYQICDKVSIDSCIYSIRGDDIYSLYY